MLLLLCSAYSFAQNKKRYLYYLNDKLEGVEKDKATIVGKGFVENGQFKLDCYPIGNDNVLLTAHFTDSSLTQLQGTYISYHPNGDVATEGNYKANNKEGLWQNWDTVGRKTDSSHYVQDKAMVKAQFEYHANGGLSSKRIKDSLANTFQEIVYDELMNITQKVEFKGDEGMITDFNKNGTTVEKLYTRVEKEAEFKGGDAGWVKYLEENMDPNVPVDNNAPAGSYQVIVQFIVNIDGTLSDITALTNHGFGMEKEVVRIIKQGPQWVPAVRFGRTIKAYRKQPVTFVVTEVK